MERVLSTLIFAGVLGLTSGAAFAQPSYPAPNGLPDPYRAGVAFGELPGGRKWINLGGVDVAPDGTIWAYDQLGGLPSIRLVVSI